MKSVVNHVAGPLVWNPQSGIQTELGRTGIGRRSQLLQFPQFLPVFSWDSRARESFNYGCEICMLHRRKLYGTTVLLDYHLGRFDSAIAHLHEEVDPRSDPCVAVRTPAGDFAPGYI